MATADLLVSVAPQDIDLTSKEDLVSMYMRRDSLYRETGTSYCHVMLMTEAYQSQSFSLVSSFIPDLTTCVGILDIGCGYGCLLSYLRSKGFVGTYLGIDLVPEFIYSAQARFRDDSKADFCSVDFFDLPVAKYGYDYLVATSIFGLVTHDSFMKDVLFKASAMANKAVIFTCNSSDHQELKLMARSYSAKDIVKECLEHSSNIEVKHQRLRAGEGYYSLVGAKISTNYYCDKE